MVTQVISDYARTFGLKSLRNQKQKLSGTLSYKVGFKTLQVQSTECSHAYSKKAGEQCPSIGRVTAPYEICHSLKSSCFTWLHTLAAPIAPHHSGLPPGTIPWYFAGFIYVKLFFNMSAARSFGLPYLILPTSAHHPTAGQVSCYHPFSTLTQSSGAALEQA